MGKRTDIRVGEGASPRSGSCQSPQRKLKAEPESALGGGTGVICKRLQIMEIVCD